MANVAVLSEFSEVIVAISHLVTPGHRLIQRSYPFDARTLCSDEPAVLVVPLFRRQAAIGRPVKDFAREVAGAPILLALQPIADLAECPVILFGIGVTPQEVPTGLRYHTFLTFPEAIQELNPLVSSLVGPAPQHGADG